MSATSRPQSPSWYNNQISTRVANFRSASVETYKTAIFSIRTIAEAGFDLATFSSDQSTQLAAYSSGNDLSGKIGSTYLSWLRVMNPKANIDEKFIMDKLTKKTAANIDKMLDSKQNSLADPTSLFNVFNSMRRIESTVSPSLLETFDIMQKTVIQYFAGKDSCWFNRQVTTRLIAPVSALVALVFGAIVTALGVIAAVFSACACGSKTNWNTFAWDNIRAPAWMLNQLHQGLLGIVRPDLV